LNEADFPKVDTVKVAAAKGYANVRSVSNRIAQLKKKYNLPFGSSAGGAKKGESTPKKASDAAGPTEPAIAATPSKQRVAKPKTPASKKKGTATPKTPANGKKAKKVEEDEDIEDQDELAVMSPKKDDTEDEGVFGKKDSDEEA